MMVPKSLKEDTISTCPLLAVSCSMDLRLETIFEAPLSFSHLVAYCWLLSNFEVHRDPFVFR